MTKRIIIYIILILSLPSLAGESEFMMKNFTTRSGLPANEVFDIMQDSRGRIWIGTDMGVSMYDGYTFTTFDLTSGLAGNTVLDIYEDYQNRIWFVSMSGRLACYQNHEIKPWKYNQNLINQFDKSPVALKHSFYIDSNDNVYLSLLHMGIYHIDSAGNIHKFNNQTNYLLFRDNRIIPSHFTFQNQQITYIKQQDTLTFKLLTEKPQIKSSLTFAKKIDTVTFLLANGNHIYLAKNDTIKPFLSFNKNISDMFLNQTTGHLWIALMGGGVHCYQQNNLNEPLYSFLENKTVTDIEVDDKNGFWFSTTDNGIYFLPNTKIKKYYPDIHAVSFIEKNRSSLIIGHQKQKITILENFFDASKNNRIIHLNLTKSPDEVIGAHFIHKNILFVGSNLAVYHVNLKKNLPADSSQAINQAVNPKINGSKANTYYQGHIYHGNASGLFRQVCQPDGSGQVVRLAYKRITSMTPDSIQNRIWMGGLLGLYYFDIQTDSLIYLGYHQPLLRHHINDINLTPSGELLLATKGNGLVVYNPQNDSIIHHITKKNGLTSNTITFIKKYKGFIWLGTNKGINFFNESNCQSRIRYLNQDDGLPSNNITDFLVHDSVAFIATNQGMVFCPLNFILKEEKPSKVSINHIEGSYQPFANKDFDFKVPYPHHSIGFKFSTFQYNHSQDILYRYRIKNKTEAWQHTYNNHILYHHLPSGTYTFEIAARNKSGLWSNPPTTVRFIIEKKFWKKNWVIVLNVLITGIIIVIAIILIGRNVHIRIKAKQDATRYQQQILSSQINPHFLFNSLNSIHLYLLENKSAAASKYLNKFARLMRVFLNNASKDFVSLQSEIESNELYLELQRMRMKEKFDFIIKTDPTLDIDTLMIPSAIVQPIVENAVVHGIRYINNYKGIILIKIKDDNKTFQIEISDNGVGRRQAAEIEHKSRHDSKGHSLITKRVKLINQLYGTKIEINYIDLYKENIPRGTNVVISNLPKKVWKS